MFEDSLFVSASQIMSARSRWTATASLTAQCLLVALLFLLPLLHTESLSAPSRDVNTLFIPPVQPPPPPQTTPRRETSSLQAASLAGSRVLTAPRTTPSRIDPSPAPSTSVSSFQGMGDPSLPGAVFDASSPGASVRVAAVPAPAAKPGPVRLSGGVVAGLLLTPIRPVYPAIAKAAHVEGVVIVEAVISRSGTIERLHVLSGPTMLQSAAMDAIRSAQYRPFLLNGEPVEVQTTITVNFRMGG